MSDIGDWMKAFYSGTPTGQPINTTGTSSFGSASGLFTDFIPQAEKALKAHTPTWMPMSITPGSTNPAPGVMGADGEVAPTGAVAGIPVPDIGEFFGRAVVIILGFIFVAAGLALFREPITQLASAK